MSHVLSEGFKIVGNSFWHKTFTSTYFVCTVALVLESGPVRLPVTQLLKRHLPHQGLLLGESVDDDLTDIHCW